MNIYHSKGETPCYELLKERLIQNLCLSGRDSPQNPVYREIWRRSLTSHLPQIGRSGKL